MRNLTYIEFREKLFSSFPNLFREKTPPAIHKGWFQLVWDLSEKLEKIILSIPEKDRENYFALQIKQKFACLRYYVNAPDYNSEAYKQISDEIKTAEQKSLETCENCGKTPAKMVQTGSWLNTKCDTCILLQ